jgi:outer membrane protein assembly factor BamB
MRHRLLMGSIVVLLAVTMTGCVGTRLGDGWAALRTIDDQQHILLAYNDRVVKVDVTKNGLPIELRDEDGNLRTDSEGQVLTWQVMGEGDHATRFFAAPIEIEENTLMIAGYDGRFFKVDAETSEIQRDPKLFEATLNTGSGCVGDCILATPAFDGDTFFVPLMHKDLVALDAEDLVVLWRFETESDTEYGIWSQPVVDKGVVYFGTMDHHLYAVEAATGEELWKVNLEGALPASPLLYNNRLYIGAVGGKVYELSTNGQILSTYETESWVWSTPVINDNILYTADTGGNVYALDISNGLKQVWKTAVAEKGIRAAPVVTDENVIVASRDGFVYWVDRGSGAKRFSEEIGAEILSDMLVIEPNEKVNLSQPLLVISTVAADKLLLALPLEGGQPIWKYPR